MVLDAARGFDGNITQPRTQSAFNATVSYPMLAASRWAAKNQAADQVGIARISAQETRRQVALTAAQSYLAVISAQRQREIALRNLDTAKALEEYAQARLEAGKGSRLNQLRSTQERAAAEVQLELAELFVRQGQEALGVSVFADGPVDAEGDPELQPAALPSDDAWLMQRPEVRLSRPRCRPPIEWYATYWKSWLPTANRFLHAPVRHPCGALRAGQDLARRLPVPGPDLRRDPGAREADAHRRPRDLPNPARRVKLQVRAELRLAQESVTRNEQIVAASRLSAESAAEALRISEIAYRAGATRTSRWCRRSRPPETRRSLFAVAEDRLRQARLDLLLALGQFP